MTTIKQDVGDIKVTAISIPKDGVNMVSIHQDGRTIFLDHANIIQFLKTVSNLK